LESRVADVSDAPTLLGVAGNASVERIEALQEQGVEVVKVSENGNVDMKALLEILAGRGVTGVLLEGGPTLASTMWERGLVDKLVFYYAPMVIGGCDAPSPIEGKGHASISGSDGLSIVEVAESGVDIRVVAYPMGR